MTIRLATLSTAALLAACGSAAPSAGLVPRTPTQSATAAPTPTSVPITTPTAAAPALAAHCHARPAPNTVGALPLPDPICTPGVADPAMTTARLCAPGFTTKTTRTVTEAEKQAVYAEYGVPYPQPLGSVEVDHLIPLTIGGSNSIGNLWLEPATPLPGFHQKDILEVRLHALVCSGQMTLAVAQHKVASDWVTTYRENVTP